MRVCLWLNSMCGVSVLRHGEFRHFLMVPAQPVSGLRAPWQRCPFVFGGLGMLRDRTMPGKGDAADHENGGGNLD